jgi:hypothetical protein
MLISQGRTESAVTEETSGDPKPKRPSSATSSMSRTQKPKRGSSPSASSAAADELTNRGGATAQPEQLPEDDTGPTTSTVEHEIRSSRTTTVRYLPKKPPRPPPSKKLRRSNRNTRACHCRRRPRSPASATKEARARPTNLDTATEGAVVQATTRSEAKKELPPTL